MNYEIVVRKPENSEEMVRTGVIVEADSKKQALKLAYAWTDIVEIN